MREEEECRQCGLRAREAQGRRQLHQLLDIPADVESGSGTCSQWSCEGDESCEVSSPCHHDDATVCTMGYTVQQTLPSLPAKEGDLDPFKPTQEQLVLAEQRKRGKWAACKTVCVEGPHFSVKGPSREQRWLGTLTMMQPSQLAVVLQELPIFNILMARAASRLFREACRCIYRLDLSQISTEWNGSSITQHLFPIFGSPLTLVSMRAARSMRTRLLKSLLQSGRIRIESIFVGWNLHGARGRIKKVGDLANFSCLREIDLGGCSSLRSVGTSILVESLATTTSLQVLGLRSCQIGAEGAMILAAMLAGRRAMLTQAVRDSAVPAALAGGVGVFDEEEGHAEADGLWTEAHAPAAVELEAQQQEVDAGGGQGDQGGLVSAVTPDSGLVGVGVQWSAGSGLQSPSASVGTGLGPGANVMRKPSDCSLTALDVQDNMIGPEGATCIAGALMQVADSCRLASLNLSLNRLRSDGMTALARALHVNTSITELNLSWNLIRSPGARALAPALAASTTLRELDLGFNLLRCNGAAFLAPAISASPSLRVLSLRRNELGPNGSTHVADALRSNTSLRSLNLGLNGLAALGAAKIGEAIAQNSTLEHMDLDWNALRELGLHVLTSGLRNKCGLTFLDLSHNKLSHESARNLASALKSLALSRQRQREGLDSRRACSAAALPCLHATSVQLNCSHPCVDGCLVGAAHGRGAGSGERGKRFGGGAGSGQGMEDGGDEVLSGRDESKHDDTGTRAQQRACRDLYATDGEGLFRAPYVADAASSWSPPTAGVVSVADTAGAVRGTEEVVVWADDAVRSQDGDVTSSGFDAGLGRVRRESLPLVLVRGNNLRPEGLAMMLPVLRADALRVLDLCDNDLRDRGCHLLARHGADLLWSLRGLNMSGNSITSKGLEVLASVLNGSTLLEELKVSRNDIQRVPKAIGSLRNLRRLSLHDNPNLVAPPPHVVEAGTSAVMLFLARSLELEARGLSECCSRVFCVCRNRISAARKMDEGM